MYDGFESIDVWLGSIRHNLENGYMNLPAALHVLALSGCEVAELQLSLNDTFYVIGLEVERCRAHLAATSPSPSLASRTPLVASTSKSTSKST
jgi:hypothetical protein